MSSAPSPANERDAEAFYDEMWQSYGHLDAVSPANFHRRRLVVELALQFAGNARTVLDVGCGQGELLRELAREYASADLTGADVSKESLAISRRKNPRFSFVQIDLAAPDFELRHAEQLERFDLVVCSEVLEHIPDDRAAARNLGKLLSPGGTLVVTVPGGQMSRFDKAIGHQRHYDDAQLRGLLEQAGLEVMKCMAWGFPFQNLYRTAVRVASRAALPDQPTSSGTATAAGERSALTRVLGRAYALFGRAMKPLFYLNGARWGEQMLAVARGR